VRKRVSLQVVEVEEPQMDPRADVMSDAEELGVREPVAVLMEEMQDLRLESESRALRKVEQPCETEVGMTAAVDAAAGAAALEEVPLLLAAETVTATKDKIANVFISNTF